MWHSFEYVFGNISKLTLKTQALFHSPYLLCQTDLENKPSLKAVVYSSLMTEKTDMLSGLGMKG